LRCSRSKYAIFCMLWPGQVFLAGADFLSSRCLKYVHMVRVRVRVTLLTLTRTLTRILNLFKSSVLVTMMFRVDLMSLMYAWVGEGFAIAMG